MRWVTLLFFIAQTIEVAAGALELVDDATVVAAPRFAAGDLDGDGRSELVIGGRTGPFVAETQPLAGRTARIEVRSQGGGLVGLRAWSEEPEVIEDIAVGDVDGDGQMEVLAVGWQRLWVWALVGNELELERVYSLAAGHLYRVDAADLDGDGRWEVVVAARSEQPGPTEREAAATHIGVYSLGASWRRLADLAVDAHVGDMCLFAGVNGVEMVVETGGEEVGGLLSGYAFSGWQPTWRYEQQATKERVRSLSLAARAVAGRAVLAVGDMRGHVGFWQRGRSGLVRVGDVELGAGLVRAVELVAGAREGGQLWVGTGMGSRGRLWKAENFK